MNIWLQRIANSRMKYKSLDFIFGILILSIASTSFASSSNAESFVVDGNKALNTNNNFVKLDGNPRMAIWNFNPSDNDQQFDRIQGSRGGTLLKHRSTGKCLNVHYLYNGGLVNTWPCNAGDPDQNFNISGLGGGYVQIQRTGTNLCVDSPTRDNGGKVHVWQCVNNSNQRWQNGSTPPPPPSGYYRDLSSLSNDSWDQYSGDSTRFDPNPQWDGKVDERWKTPPSISQIYSDLGVTIFGNRRPMNTGYLYDQGYYNAYKKWHAGLDIDAPNGTSVKAVIGGVTWNIQNISGNYFMAVKGDDGKLWIYGHLGSLNVGNGVRIEAGQLIGKTGSQNHLHLEVQNDKNNYAKTDGAHGNQQFVRDTTFSPIQAFWQVKNR